MWWSPEKLPKKVEAEQRWSEVEEAGEVLFNASATIDIANGHDLGKNGDVTDTFKLNGIGANVDGTAYGEVVDEEVVKLEFEKLKPKLATHTVHCPHCESDIWEVILRKVLSVVPGPDRDKFDPYINRPESPIATEDDTTIKVVDEPGDFPGFYPLPESPRATEEDDTTVNMENEPGDFTAFFHSDVNMCSSTICIASDQVGASPRGRSWLGYNSPLVEILKSIVYGGLMEVIASLSVVASAAASDATTMSIISVALASLIGRVFVIRHNLWDLRDDCYHYNSNSEDTSKYKELLGQVNYFPLHAFFAILSFLVFGIVPVVAYGYSFYETNDKDFTLVAVATSSLLCVALLAIFKAYIDRCTFIGFFKTVVYYVTTAISMSGVSYVVGNLVTRLMEEWGLFGPSSGGGMSFFPDATISLASF